MDSTKKVIPLKIGRGIGIKCNNFGWIEKLVYWKNAGGEGVDEVMNMGSTQIARVEGGVASSGSCCRAVDLLVPSGGGGDDNVDSIYVS